MTAHTCVDAVWLVVTLYCRCGYYRQSALLDIVGPQNFATLLALADDHHHSVRSPVQSILERHIIMNGKRKLFAIKKQCDESPCDEFPTLGINTSYLLQQSHHNCGREIFFASQMHRALPCQTNPLAESVICTRRQTGKGHTRLHCRSLGLDIEISHWVLIVAESLMLYACPQ